MDFITDLAPILRPLHIISGVLWVGYGTLVAWILHPAANVMGDQGDTMLRHFYSHSRFNKIMPWAAIVTTVAGLLMWPWAVSGADWVHIGGRLTAGDWIMMAGAVFGLLAFGHSVAATGRFSGKYATLAGLVEDADTPASDHEEELAVARKKLFLHSNISAWLTIISLTGMVGARYIGIWF